MPHASESWRPRRPSFTLLEVLLALALTAVMVAASGPMATSALRLRQAVEDTTLPLLREAIVFDRIARDLFHRQSGLTLKATQIRLYGQPLQSLEIDTLAAALGEVASLHVSRLPSVVRYRLVNRTAQGKELDLVREVQDRTDASGLWHRETLGVGLIAFEVEVLANGKWSGTYPALAADPKADLAALRIQLAWPELGTVSRTIVLHGHP